MKEKPWWQKPMRVMQYNLQVADTAGMDAERIAEQTERLACNVVVMNVGGIYAWYPSKIKYHHINEFLPKDYDLLKELIEAFHKRKIRFVARFDFSMTEDTTYLQRPGWFARKRDKTPYYRGEKRMGTWSLLLNTCANSGYRNEEVAVPVLQEVLKRYQIDGIFLNAPMASACFCEKCQEKYRQIYGINMPETEAEYDADWLSKCTKDNIGVLYRAIREIREEVPLILYYIPYTWEFPGAGRIDRDSIYERYATADLICTESQNILSKGRKQIPETAHPILSMKAGQRDDERIRPFGIIHSCPGMDWRHVGLPTAEYLPWMSQIPASGGVLWHSVTGYPDTITDKRILNAIDQIDHRILKCEQDMETAKSRAEVLLIWDSLEASKAWADMLLKNHISFDLMQDYHINPEKMSHYRMVIIPDGLIRNDVIFSVAESYVRNGGSLLIESTEADMVSAHASFLGIGEDAWKGEYLTASYLRLEQEGRNLGKEMDTDLIAFRGSVLYCSPNSETRILATLVPPFAPLEVVGAPPERASIPVSRTDIPLIMEQDLGQGQLLFLPFSLSMLTRKFGLMDHYQLAGNLIDQMLGRRELEVTAPSSVQVTMYENERGYLIHLVNETGERPLRDTISIRNVHISIALPYNWKDVTVSAKIEEHPLLWKIENERLEIELDQIDVWEMIAIYFFETKGDK